MDRKILYAIARANNKADRDAVDSIIRQFFKRTRHGFWNKRAKKELLRTHEISTKRANAGKQKTKHSANAEQMQCKPEARSQTPDSQDHLSIGIAAEETPDATAAAFAGLGYDQPFGPTEFRAAWTREFSAASEGGFTDAMERTAKFCESRKIKIPKLFFTLKRKVEDVEIENRFHRTPL